MTVLGVIKVIENLNLILVMIEKLCDFSYFLWLICMVCELCFNKAALKKKLKHWDITNKTVIFPQVLTDQLHSLPSGKVHGKLNCNQKAA